MEKFPDSIDPSYLSPVDQGDLASNSRPTDSDSDQIAPENAKILNWYNRVAPIYECALEFTRATIHNVAREFETTLEEDQRPFDLDRVTYRVKELRSIRGKCARRGYPWTIQGIKENIRDIAGVRIIANTCHDIDLIAEALKAQPALAVEEEKDYVRQPKPNGYRSRHLIVTQNVYFAGRAHSIHVEIQIRTKAMNLWSEFEHKVRYKKRAGVTIEASEQGRIDNFLAGAAAALVLFDDMQDHLLRDDDLPESDYSWLSADRKNFQGHISGTHPYSTNQDSADS